MSDETTDDSGMSAMDSSTGGTSMMGMDDEDPTATATEGSDSSDEGDSHMEV